MSAHPHITALISALHDRAKCGLKGARVLARVGECTSYQDYKNLYLGRSLLLLLAFVCILPVKEREKRELWEGQFNYACVLRGREASAKKRKAAWV